MTTATQSEATIRASSFADVLGPFKIGERELEAICKAIATIGPVEIAATCNDRTRRYFISMEQLCSYENAPASAMAKSV